VQIPGTGSEFTFLTRAVSDYLTDRYSQRKEEMEKARRININVL
jgi:hypothetical protein